MTIQKTGFLKQLSNGCKVYTQKVGTNAVTEVLNIAGRPDRGKSGMPHHRL